MAKVKIVEPGGGLTRFDPEDIVLARTIPYTYYRDIETKKIFHSPYKFGSDFNKEKVEAIEGIAVYIYLSNGTVHSLFGGAARCIEHLLEGDDLTINTYHDTGLEFEPVIKDY